MYTKSRTTIPPHSNLTISILGARYCSLKLPKDYDFIFKLESLKTLLPCAYIINISISYIFVRNNTNNLVVLARN